MISLLLFFTNRLWNANIGYILVICINSFTLFHIVVNHTEVYFFNIGTTLEKYFEIRVKKSSFLYFIR